jgi:hypothetical protein
MEKGENEKKSEPSHNCHKQYPHKKMEVGNSRWLYFCMHANSIVRSTVSFNFFLSLIRINSQYRSAK